MNKLTPLNADANAPESAAFALAELLDDIAQSLDSIALYFERKGIKEGILKPEDVRAESDEGESGANNGAH